LKLLFPPLLGREPNPFGIVILKEHMYTKLLNVFIFSY
jgi:hypothetical protein